MNHVRGIIGLVATIFIAAVVAYSVSAPRNVDNFMNAEVAALDGKSIGDSIAEAQTEARQAQCDSFTRSAEDAWNRSIEQGTTDRDAANLDELDQQVARFCD